MATPGDRHHRADHVVDRLGLGWRFQTEVGETVALVQNKLLSKRDQYGRSHHSLLRDRSLRGGIQAVGGVIRISNDSQQCSDEDRAIMAMNYSRRSTLSEPRP